jgi:hypothetical protein
MNSGNNQEAFQVELQTITATVQALAQHCRGDVVELLRLLRVLEALHRDIRDGLFQEALPTNRQALYTLLRDIEIEGGWPYISRMKLKLLLENLESESA